MVMLQKWGNLARAVNTTVAGGTRAFRNYEAFKKTAKEKLGFEIQN